MAKHFSVDWLAQSHYKTTLAEDQGAADGASVQRPHVPCMVQPRAPTSYYKRYLQPKPKAPGSPEGARPAENGGHPEDGVSSPAHPAHCSSPVSEISGYSSGYESEAASSECLSLDEGCEGEKDGAHQRRVRTKFTPEQIHKLERIFTKHKYLDAGERAKTAQRLNLSETQVRTWFQNRRMKLKREMQDLRAEYLSPAISPVLVHHVPAVQYHGYGRQRLHFSPAAALQPFHPAMVPQVAVQQQQQQQQPAVSHQPMHPMMPYPHYY
ncbi:ventral homeobox [Lampris incognitus]|uniref:ventral homeobox n=1 Tax=Lampris incognitus TaxID=2546036 RepID=UPI0024B55420|nr:ventral homeobox [Lampris incognitus]